MTKKQCGQGCIRERNGLGRWGRSHKDNGFPKEKIFKGEKAFALIFERYERRFKKNVTDIERKSVSWCKRNESWKGEVSLCQKGSIAVSEDDGYASVWFFNLVKWIESSHSLWYICLCNLATILSASSLVLDVLDLFDFVLGIILRKVNVLNAIDIWEYVLIVLIMAIKQFF
jgi:hypothetical protein